MESLKIIENKDFEKITDYKPESKNTSIKGWKYISGSRDKVFDKLYFKIDFSR